MVLESPSMSQTRRLALDFKACSNITDASSGRSLMCSRKSVGPRMEPQEIPVLTGIFQSHQLLTKDEIRPNIWLEIL